MNIAHMKKEGHCPSSPSIFRSFEKMELVRLYPLLPGQQAGDHCVRLGLTKSTSFPRAVRKEIGGKQEKGVDWEGKGGNERGLKQ